MSRIVQRQTAELKPKFGMRSINFRSKFAELAGNWRLKLGQAAPAVRGEGVRLMPSTPLGKYLWYAAKLFEIIDEAADERLISEHLHSNSPLHMRRTLDQFYYWTVIDTTAQDQNQVVCHGTRSSNDPEATGRVVMVDQLWMWILDESKTCLYYFVFRRYSSIIWNYMSTKNITLNRHYRNQFPSTMGSQQA